jgi:hypothetical protein
MISRYALVPAAMLFLSLTATCQTPLFQGIRLVNGSGSATLQAPASGHGTFRFPSSSGANGEYLVSDGAGGTSWASGLGVTSLDGLSDAKAGGTGFTNSILIGHATTGTLSGAENNVGFGGGALAAITAGDDNVAVGFNSLYSLSTGSSNTAVGFDAGRSIAGSSQYNTLVGYMAKRNFTVSPRTGDYNTAIGADAMEEAYGDYNVVVGYYAGFNIRSSNNIVIGNNALALGNATGGNNIAIGGSAMSQGIAWRKLQHVGLVQRWYRRRNRTKPYNRIAEYHRGISSRPRSYIG